MNSGVPVAKSQKPWPSVWFLDYDAGTKLQRQIGTKKEKGKVAKVQPAELKAGKRHKAEKPFRFEPLSLCAFVPLPLKLAA
jgi:hypothetical protein